jgi:hypothetical protein
MVTVQEVVPNRQSSSTVEACARSIGLRVFASHPARQRAKQAFLLTDRNHRLMIPFGLSTMQ